MSRSGMGKSEYSRTVAGSDSGYGDDIIDRLSSSATSSSSAHPLCKSSKSMSASRFITIEYAHQADMLHNVEQPERDMRLGLLQNCR